MREENILKNILDKCNENNYSLEDIELVKKSYEYAKEKHQGMMRKNGDIFLIHPLTAAEIVANLNSDVTTIVSAMVHESVKRGTLRNQSLIHLRELLIHIGDFELYTCFLRFLGK